MDEAIVKYEELITGRDERISQMKDIIDTAQRENDTTLDLEDIKAEIDNASHDRRLYLEFVNKLREIRNEYKAQ